MSTAPVESMPARSTARRLSLGLIDKRNSWHEDDGIEGVPRIFCPRAAAAIVAENCWVLSINVTHWSAVRHRIVFCQPFHERREMSSPSKVNSHLTITSLW